MRWKDELVEGRLLDFEGEVGDGRLGSGSGIQKVTRLNDSRMTKSTVCAHRMERKEETISCVQG